MIRTVSIAGIGAGYNAGSFISDQMKDISVEIEDMQLPRLILAKRGDV